ncbi:MAG: anaerobic ribonucleoside-triphosphate reductase activating protein [Candidatus Aenigmatarchaeota archaeon]
MDIKGVQKISLIEYPGRVSCVVFLPGCNFRCPFCYNTGLVLTPENVESMPGQEFFSFLEGRKKWIEAVVVTGGEPCLSPDLPELIKKIKEMEYLVGLETNGTNPRMLERLIKENLVDYIAMDIKGPKERYPEIAGAKVNIRDIQKSIDLVRGSGLQYEFRTTFVPGLVGKQDMKRVGKWLEGAERYGVQRFMPKACLDKTFESKVPYSKEELEEIAGIARKFFKKVEVRE